MFGAAGSEFDAGFRFRQIDQAQGLRLPRAIAPDNNGRTHSAIQFRFLSDGGHLKARCL